MVLVESRKGELCVAAIESIEIGWSLLRGLGAPAEITLAGPNPIEIPHQDSGYTGNTEQMV